MRPKALISNLCKAVDHSPSWRGVKKQHGHPHYIVEQPRVQHAGGVNGSIGQEQSAEEHKEACSRGRESLNKDKKALKFTKKWTTVAVAVLEWPTCKTQIVQLCKKTTKKTK